MNSCLIVLVLYKQELRETASYQSLMAAWPSSGGMKLLIYDNSPEAQFLNQPPEHLLIQYIHDPSNPGVGKAYNVAASMAQEEGYRWLMLMDQDSTFPANIFHAYAASIQAFPQVLIFGPCLFDHRGLLSPFGRGKTSGRRLGKISPGLHSLTDVAIINSGLLIDVRAYHQSRGYDERLSLDFSDINFLSRFSKISTDLVVVDIAGQQVHSDQPHVGYQDALRRFRQYRQAARVMAELEHASFAYRLRTLARAFKLSWRYRSFRFLHTALTASI
ncbi:MAG TPA: hypothetical protein PLX35_09375 [Cyclobacteriaceae bacterium]|nr:hypothetical protein [Cyclobacteriaceae bacterium]